MKKYLLFCMIFSFVISSLFPQKQANVWYFSEYCGLDFATDPPTLLPGIDMHRSSTCMSDADGNFIFASDGETVWNSNKEIMNNGIGLIGGGAAWNGAVAVQKPGSDHLYYLFGTPNWINIGEEPPGFYYSVIDLTLDGGLGAVTAEKNVPLISAWDAYEKVMAVKHANNKDIWIITRKHQEDSYASFLLTENGVDDTPVISYSPNRPFRWLHGNMKITHDKKYFITGYSDNSLPPNSSFATYDICRFDAETGVIDFMYTLDPDEYGDTETPNSVEFSPDAKLAYLAHWTHNNPGGIYYKIEQYDMSLIEDSAQFVESAIVITEKGGYALQLGRDGQIYCGKNWSSHDSLSVIHKPWIRGTGCSFEENVIIFENGAGFFGNLPNIMLDYLYRFEWEGKCKSSPFVFQHNFQPIPDYISWNFGDPASGDSNFSQELNPSHLFTDIGEFEVSVFVRYPSGRTEYTSRVVTVEDVPHPGLGPGYFICEGEEVSLYAGEEEGMYVWSTGEFGQNLNTITVSDSGWYWVQVTAEIGCFGIDSVYVVWYLKAEINQDSLELIPTSCGNSNGAITGLSITGKEPLSYYWYDGSGTLLDSTLDLYNLPAGNYFLHILDGYGCTTISPSYTITDAGEVEISEVDKQDSHCNQQTGSISITANTPIPGELLYSIDNGNTWQTGNNTFSNLVAGSYFVRVKDENDCEGIWENNPVVIDNIDGPQLSSATTLPEIDHLSNGEIDLLATVSSGDIHYSIDNGNSLQLNNGHFTNLTAGIYYCLIKDDFGCDTSFTVKVELKLSQLIEAIAGDGYTCIGNATVVPLVLNNFTDIFSYNVKLTYDSSVLICDGYIKAHPLLKEKLLVSIVPLTDQIVISWQGEQPETLEDNATMLELVFSAKTEGVSGIDWAAEEGESVFYNEQQEEISAEYYLGVLRVYTRPSIMIFAEREFCENDFFFMSAFVSGGTGDISYLWEGPNGYEHTGSFVEFENITQSQAGIYNLRVSDTINCVETEQINVSVYYNPLIGFPPTDTIYEQPGFVLDAGEGYPNYLWNTGDTTNSIEIDIEGLYSVLITSGQDCKSTDSVTVLWGQSAFYLPNAFTPNGDGLNDEFKPVQKYDFVNTYHLSIFSRWGEMIFETSDINRGWDGSYKGNPTQQGTYIYKIVYTAWPNKEEQQVVTGSVMLVR